MIVSRRIFILCRNTAEHGRPSQKLFTWKIKKIQIFNDIYKSLRGIYTRTYLYTLLLWRWSLDHIVLCPVDKGVPQVVNRSISVPVSVSRGTINSNIV